MTFFGYRFAKEKDFRLTVAALASALEENTRLNFTLTATESLSKEKDHQISILKQKVDENRVGGVIDVDIGDPIPSTGDARKVFVLRVAGFHKDVLSKKLYQMISAFHRLLEEETNDRETDLYLKIGTYVCRDLIKWGDLMINEALSYQIEPPLTAEEKVIN